MNLTLSTDSSDNEDSLQFTLTCISTGGPATNVTWTRDSVTVTEGTQTVLNDPETAQYTHTLTITGRQQGMYKCSVTNAVSRNTSKVLNVQGKIFQSELIMINITQPSSLSSY